MEDNPVTAQPKAESLPSADAASEVTVRSMTAADAAFVSRWLILGFKDKLLHNVRKNRVEPMIEMETINFSHATPEVYKNILVAEYEGRPAGVASLKFHNQPEMERDENLFCEKLGCWATCWLARFGLWEAKTREGELMLDQIAVAEGYRGKGIGTALLNAVDDRAREANIKTVYLWVIYGNRAKNLYERHGYQEVELYNGCCRTWCAAGVWKVYRMAKEV